ncbi:hypothetical protein Tco_0363691 [Tanacetum coccineum]
MDKLLKEVLMIDELSIVETYKGNHTVEMNMLKLVVEVECFKALVEFNHMYNVESQYTLSNDSPFLVSNLTNSSYNLHSRSALLMTSVHDAFNLLSKDPWLHDVDSQKHRFLLEGLGE